MNYKRISVIALIAILAIGLAVVSYFLVEKQEENKEIAEELEDLFEEEFEYDDDEL